MSQTLAAMLDKPEEAVSAAVAKLEAKAGYPSEDVRLIALSSQQTKAKIAQLGLDPEDTTPEELYHALVSRFVSDCDHLDKALNIETDASVAERASKGLQLAAHLIGGSEGWAIKTVALKNLLRQLPPKKLMKALSYRSVDSMLKREKAASLLIAAKLTESASWQKNIASKIAHLGSSDFEMRAVQLIDLSSWHNLKAASIAVAAPEVSAVGLIGLPSLANYRTLSIALALADGANGLALKRKGLPLKHLSPSLAWWTDAEHLIAWNNGQAVSLNIMDTALNHSESRSFNARSRQRASHSIWQRLIDGYKEHIEELPEELAEIDGQAQDKVRGMVAPAALAEEYVEA